MFPFRLEVEGRLSYKTRTPPRMRAGPVIAFLLLVVGAFAGGLYWWFSHPILIVHLDSPLTQNLDKAAYRSAFFESGVKRVRLMEDSEVAEEELGEKSGEVLIALKLSDERNPEIDKEGLEQGLTGPGYTYGYVGYVYAPDVDLFLNKHKATLIERGVVDMEKARRRLITNTAVHESWHAIAQSVSHNPKNTDSVMFIDPGRIPEKFAGERLRFTEGHKVRLTRIFKPEF